MTAPVQAQPEAAVAFYNRGQTIAAAILLALRALWRRFDPQAIDVSYAALLPELVAMLAAGQVAAARSAVAYVPQVLEETGVDAPAVGQVRPIAFVGASSGATLPRLLATVPPQAKKWSGEGATLEDIDAQALRLLEGIVQTQVADAARQATAAGIGSRPDLTGWVRMIDPPACGRCVILAGRVYRWNAGFEQHPRCDCRHLPVTVASADSYLADPDAYFRNLPAAEQDRTFGRSTAQAIRDGADMARAVNATGRRAGMTTVQDGIQFTTEAATKGRLRLTPDGIYSLASDRADAIRLLRAHGYIT